MMQDPSHSSRSSQKCPSCQKSLYYSSTRCSDCGWQAWHTTQEFIWLLVALVIGGLFVFGLSRQNSDYTSAEVQRDQQYDTVREQQSR
jgi:hypothetical protein